MIAEDMLTQAQQRCIPDVSFELIPIRNLVSNQEYQRPLSENHIRKALEEFDVYQINPVKVSRRDGINYVFDGQHTIEIIASESGSRDTPVWCMIYDDLKYKEEAHIFADQQKHVKALSSFETFKAHIEADDPKQKMIEAIVQSYGLAITSTKAKNGISAVSTLERIYDKYGQAVLDRTLRLASGNMGGRKQLLLWQHPDGHCSHRCGVWGYCPGRCVQRPCGPSVGEGNHPCGKRTPPRCAGLF